MQERISRRKLAQFIISQMGSKHALAKALQELAAYLITTKRVREVNLVVRTIEDELAKDGVVVARVVSAHELSATLKRDITKLIGAREVHFSETIDPDVLGGVRIETPGKLLDATIQRKILALRQAKQ